MTGLESKAAFVIQFRDSTDFEAGRVEGKVEHIASYRAARFRSIDELLGFIGRVLAESRSRDGTPKADATSDDTTARD